nr:MAG TPA: hypothetical protein [Caudoviricetes sp.]
MGYILSKASAALFPASSNPSNAFFVAKMLAT